MTTRFKLSVIKQIPDSQLRDSKHESTDLFRHRRSQTPWQNLSGTWVRGPLLSCPLSRGGTLTPLTNFPGQQPPGVSESHHQGWNDPYDSNPVTQVAHHMSGMAKTLLY